MAFSPIVAFGPHSAEPHHVNSRRRLAKNDTALLDIGCVYQGYCSDLTRTFFLGKICELQKQIYSLVSEAQTLAVKGIRSGRKASDIDGIARSVISRRGYGPQFIHSTGHGVGIDIHEPPRISNKDNTVLKPGMVITVEPGIYLPGKFGVRIEDTVLVTHKGNEVLTR